MHAFTYLTADYHTLILSRLSVWRAVCATLLDYIMTRSVQLYKLVVVDPKARAWFGRLFLVDKNPLQTRLV